MSIMKQSGLASRNMAAVVLLGALLMSGAAPTSAVVVDNFDTDQAVVSDPPGANASSVAEAMPGDILGDNRDLATTRVLGAGTVSGEVTGGNFSLTITDTTPDTSGEVELTWDGDTDPDAFDPIGLGNQDLTAANHSAFRLQVEQATDGAEIVVEVFTDGANSSIAILRLPSVVATQNFLLSYSKDFIPNLGAGADFSDVGAITMTVRGREVTVLLGLLETVAPSIEVTMQDRDPGTDLPLAAPAVPGQTIKYRVEITNTGGEALGVDFADMVDANTTLDMASVDVFAIAADDTYRVVGNGSLAPSVANGVLANDSDPDSGTPGVPGDVVTCLNIATELEKCKVVEASSSTTSAAGGTITWIDTDPSPADGMSDGQFQYTPPGGFTGVDRFTYTFADDEGNTASAAVSVLVGPTVWFVDDDAAGSANLGTQADPFNSIASLNTNLNGAGGGGDVDEPGDIIFIFNGTDNSLALTQAIELEDEQQLIGEGSGLTIFGTEFVPADVDPVLTAATDDGITLATDNLIRGLTIGNTMGFAITGNNFGTLTADNVVIAGTGGALSLENGSHAGSFESISSTNSPGVGINFEGISGDFLVNGSTTIETPTTTGIFVGNGGSTFDFGATTITMAGGRGINLVNCPTGLFTFDSLSVSTAAGIGILVQDAGVVNINSTAASVAATGGAAVDFFNTTGQTNGNAATGWTFATLSSTNSPTSGISLANMPNNFTVLTSTMVTDADSRGIRVANSSGRSIDFGATTVMDTNTAAAPDATGVDLTANNAGATFTFDSLAITAQGDGLLANNSGTINVVGTGNTINAVGGRAVDVMATTFDDGAAGGGATFSSVSSSNSATTGINLVSVSGFFTANGGSITGAAGNAFSVGSPTDLSGGAGDITYAGSITNTAGRSVFIEERNGGTVTVSGNVNDTGTGMLAQNNNNGTANIITLSGTSKVFNTATDTAIDLNNNDDATINFTGGGLDVDTTTATAFEAANGAAGINVTTDGGTGNSVATTTATAVSISDSTLGANGVEFERIDSTTGSANVVIALDDTGAGTFTVTGSGTTDGSGGTISGKMADGVTLSNTDGLVDLRNMLFEDIGDMSGGFDQSSGHDAIHGEIVDGGLRLENVTIRRISDQAINGTLLADGISASTWTGLELRDSTIEDTNRFHIANVADSQADEAMVKILGLSGTVTVDNNTLQRGIELLDFTTLGSGTLNMTVTRNSFSRAYKEFTSGVIPAVGRACVDVNVEGSSTVNVTIGDEADDSLGNNFLNCGVASIRMVKGIAAAGNANIDFIIARNSFRGDDKSSTLGTAGNFPQGGVALRAGPGGVATFDAIVSRNTFGVFVPPDDRMGSTTDEIMNADGVEGNLVMIFEEGVSQARVDNNEFNGAINAPWNMRADNNTSAAVLVQNNTYRGRDDFFSPDPGFGTFTVPGVPSRTRVLGGGNLDLTFRDETFVFHDQFFFALTEVVEFETLNVGPGGSGSPPFGGDLCLHFDTVVSPDGFEFEEQAGSIELFQGANNAPATGPCTAGAPGDCEAEMADDGNRGGPSTRNQATGVPTPGLNPPFVDIDGGSIDITATPCTEPSGGIF